MNTFPEVPKKQVPLYTAIPVGSPLAISLQLGDSLSEAVIQLRNSTGELQGTLILDQDGIQYKKPNQKKAPDRRLNWNHLAKLMELGLVPS